MVSLFELPQCIWRYKIIGFFKKVEDLVRLDSAVCNRTERKLFLTSISGCKQFGDGYFVNEKGKIRWFALREIIVMTASMGGELSTIDEPYVPQVLSHAEIIIFATPSLPIASLFPQWIASTALLALQLNSSEFDDCSGLSVCITLTYLRLTGCCNITDAHFARGISGCTQLTDCYLLNCAKLRAHSIVVLLNNCIHLTHLNLAGCFDLEEVFTHTTAALALKDFTCIEDSHQSVLLSGAAMNAMALVTPQLTSLHLMFTNNSVFDEDVDVLVQRCKHLEKLKLSSCFLLTSAALISMAQMLPRLYFLQLEHCSGIDDTGVVALAACSLNLEVLFLQNAQITDYALRELGTHCRNLQYLNVDDCTLLTDAAFATLNVARLKVLSLSGTSVTGIFATHILGSDSALDCLMCNPGELLDGNLVHSMSQTSRVKTLLLGPNLLTEAEWLELSTKFPLLHALLIIGVAAVNDTVALSFRAHCPNLKNPSFLSCSVSADVL